MDAKELFEKLGYKIKENDKFFLIYYKICNLQNDKEIIFHKGDRTITVKDDNGIKHRWINLKELQAIKKQIEEFGWNNDSKKDV